MVDPKFTITAKILNALNRIEVIREKIALCPIHPKEEYRLKREAILSMVHHSTAIEGNTLNEFEIQKVLAGGKIDAPAREIYEVQNYKKALDWISRKKTKNITEKDLLKIHGLVSANLLRSERIGQYRKEPVYVVSRTPISQEIRYTAPDHKQIPKLVRDLCKWIAEARHKQLSPIIIAGIAHAEIAAIHPFVDGNGRTARLLATLILYTEKYDFRKLFALENYYNTNRLAYYAAIHLGKNYEERNKGNLTKWLEYFATGFLTEMELVMDKIKPFFYLGRSSSKTKIILSRDEIKILDFLQEMNNISSKDIEDVLTVSKRTAQRYLAGLIKKGLVKKHGDKKSSRYTLK
ncbi:Fic family protein [Candidatus Peregrinibacteria bacterium]|nr:Fic family protein [Candidatus Peregrinibacteria bacterium]